MDHRMWFRYSSFLSFPRTRLINPFYTLPKTRTDTEPLLQLKRVLPIPIYSVWYNTLSSLLQLHREPPSSVSYQPPQSLVEVLERYRLCL